MNGLTKTKEIDMCNGPLFGKMLRFAVPIMLSGVLQLLFNAADTIVVGRFVGNEALAAVGSIGSLVNMMVNLFMGLSVGTRVLVARYYGAGQYEKVSDTVHTAIMVSLLGGVILIVAGEIFARQVLLLMGSPTDVIDLAALYIRIYFLGMPVVLLYNYGSAVLKSVGDADHPLYYLVIAGVLNVILNLVFVIVFNLSVAGVALATIISQCLSAFLVLRKLMKAEGAIRVELERLRFHKEAFWGIMRIGLPAGIQGSLFSLSNTVIQSAVNSFGSVVMAGNSAAVSLDGFLYAALNSFQQTAINFTSQNRGAGKYERTTRVLLLCSVMVSVFGICLGCLGYAFGRMLLGIYSSDAEVIGYGLVHMRYVTIFYFMFGLMDVFAGYLRGMGYSLMPTVVTLLGVCLLRMVWIAIVFPMARSYETICYSYLASWVVTITVHLICMVITCRKYWRKGADTSI